MATRKITVAIKNKISISFSIVILEIISVLKAQDKVLKKHVL